MPPAPTPTPKLLPVSLLTPHPPAPVVAPGPAATSLPVPIVVTPHELAAIDVAGILAGRVSVWTAMPNLTFWLLDTGFVVLLIIGCGYAFLAARARDMFTSAKAIRRMNKTAGVMMATAAGLVALRV